MTIAPRPEPAAQPGQSVRWRHPRLALARGWFNAFGPGPFEVVRVVAGSDPAQPLAYVVTTPAGESTLNALWVGLPAAAPLGRGEIVTSITDGCRT